MKNKKKEGVQVEKEELLPPSIQKLVERRRIFTFELVVLWLKGICSSSESAIIATTKKERKRKAKGEGKRRESFLFCFLLIKLVYYYFDFKKHYFILK